MCAVSVLSHVMPSCCHVISLSFLDTVCGYPVPHLVPVGTRDLIESETVQRSHFSFIARARVTRGYPVRVACVCVCSLSGLSLSFHTAPPTHELHTHFKLFSVGTVPGTRTHTRSHRKRNGAKISSFFKFVRVC